MTTTTPTPDRRAARPGANPGGPDRRGLALRVVVAAVGLTGLVALVCSDLVAHGIATVAAVAFLAGSYASWRLTSAVDVSRRKAVSIGILLVVAGYAAFATVGNSAADPSAGLATVGPLLASLLVGIQVAHSVVLNGRRELLVGLVIGVFMTVLAAGLSPGLVVAVPLLVAWPAAVTGMVLAHRLTEVDGADAVAVLHKLAPGSTHPPRTAGRVATVVGVCVLIGLAVFLLLPQPPGISARSRLLGGDAPDPGATAGLARSPSYYTDGYLDLRMRGALSSDPVLEVPADSPQLWRSAVLDVYDGGGWTNSQTGARSMGAGPDYQLPLSDSDVVPAGTALRTDTVLLRPGAAGAVVAPGPVTALHADSGHLIRVGSGLVLYDSTVGVRQYRVTSVPEVLDAETLRASTGTDLRDHRWTQLPSTVPLRVRQLAEQVTSGAATRYDAVSAVERYLRSNETYRLDSPVPRPGEDPVDDFLFVSHQGFCEQFASAEVVLLRSRGIPARLATGFAYGVAAPGDRRVMLASDAHAWVEVWYPGIGWASSDPTAGAALSPAAQPSLVGRVTAKVESLASTAGGRVVLALGVLAVGAAVALLVRLVVWRRRRSARAAAAAGPPPGPVLTAFLRLDRALRAAGRPSHPAETLDEYGYRLPASARAAVRTLERECYGGTPPDAAASAEAVLTFDRLTAETVPAERR